MIPKKFLISGLLAAGFFKPGELQASLTDAAAGVSEKRDRGQLFQIFRQDHPVYFADHRSHRSHSSHSSHRSSSGGHYSHTSHTSHRSSTGGYSAPVYSPPVSAPTYSDPAPAISKSQPSQYSTVKPQSLADMPSSAGPDRASPPRTGASETIQGRAARFAAIVRRVQIGLLGHGSYLGAIDGHVGPSTRAALRQFQKVHNLKVTGTITPQTLDALRVASN